MKRTFRYIIGITCSLAAVFSCARINEEDIAPDKGKIEKVVFSAVIEGGEQTKTVLGGEMGDEYRRVLWQPEDSVGICISDWGYSATLHRFVNTETEESENASLAGEIGQGYATYYAFYPYSADLIYWDYANITFFQPSVQNYRKNSFNGNAMPMVARANYGEVFEFYSICGALAVNLTGSETVKSISFTGYDAEENPVPVAGNFMVYMGYDAYPEMVPSTYAGSGTLSSITLDCGDGVALDPSDPTAFYIVLPVGTYNTFTITVNTTDGKIMLKQGTNPLNIRRANVTKAGSLAFVEEVAFDLSEHGTANSYIVSEPGLYSFMANVIGNGGYGILEGKNFHTEDPFITPRAAKLIWEDRPGVVGNVTSDDNRVSFVTNGQEGNALIGVVDESGTILWSWHIWVTDQPQEQTYINGEDQYVMLDRNLGAISPVRGSGEEWKDAVGLMYQWGRKDPFTFRYAGVDNYYDNRLYTTSSDVVQLSRSIENPTVFYGSGYYYWNESANTALWDSSQKTIYDPCPVGYVMPVRDVWKGFTTNDSYWAGSEEKNVSGSYDNGYDFIYDGINTTYYPETSWISHNGDLYSFTDFHTYLWTSEVASDVNTAYSFHNYYYTYVESWFSLGDAPNRSNAFSVRCMKDNGYIDAAKPLVKIVGAKDITAESVTLEALVADEGSTSVVERGIVWGTFKDLTLENGNVETASDAGKGNYSIEVTGLKPATKYFYRAYAKNEEYTSYSEAKYFFTPYEGNVFNLSQEGTANSYIVPPVYAEYAFDASVKGNSRESVGEIASAEVLWETAMKYDDIQKGEIISEVSVDGNNVRFTLSPEVKQGNALIAVKDAEGTILWSWHIWVVDFDPVATQQKYQSGAIMMDRNLGATSVIPDYQGAETTDYSAYGLYYQWGRKDPFPYLGSIVPLSAVQTEDYCDTVEGSYKNPTTVYVSPVWLDDTMWQSSKTMYDPCPTGWRVPDPSAWDGWDNEMTNYWDNYKMVQNPYSTPTAYYPYADRVEGWNTWPSAISESVFVWSVDRTENLYAHGSWGCFSNNDDTRDESRMPVRCMKEQKMESGDNEGYTGSDYEW